MAYATRLWNERKITCTEQVSNPRLPITSRVWYPVDERVNHAAYVATYSSLETKQSIHKTFFSFEIFVCIMAKSQIKFSRAKKALQALKERSK